VETYTAVDRLVNTVPGRIRRDPQERVDPPAGVDWQLRQFDFPDPAATVDSIP